MLCLGGPFQSLDAHGFHLVGHSLVQLLLQLTDLHLYRLEPLGGVAVPTACPFHPLAGGGKLAHQPAVIPICFQIPLEPVQVLHEALLQCALVCGAGGASV